MVTDFLQHTFEFPNFRKFPEKWLLWTEKQYAKDKQNDTVTDFVSENLFILPVIFSNSLKVLRAERTLEALIIYRQTCHLPQ